MSCCATLSTEPLCTAAEHCWRQPYSAWLPVLYAVVLYGWPYCTATVAPIQCMAACTVYCTILHCYCSSLQQPYCAWLLYMHVLYTVLYGLPYCTATAAPCSAIQCMVACACLYCLVLYCLAGHIALLLWNSSYACCTTVSRATELISLACMV